MINLCLHIYDPNNTQALLGYFSERISHVDRILISAPSCAVGTIGNILKTISDIPPFEIYSVANTSNDWSGYLTLLRECKVDTLIVGNDSIVTRRIIRKRDAAELFDLTVNAVRPCLVGELDSAKVSVIVDGRSSTSWVSSYMFGLKFGLTTPVQAADWIEGRRLSITPEAKASFMSYLSINRPELIARELPADGKLSAMYHERLLTEYAMRQSFDIVSQYGGNWMRKFARFIESIFL